MPNNDLSILISTLINQTSKKNLITEVEELTKTLQQKLGNININIGGANLDKLVTELNKINSATQKIKTPQFNFDVQTQELLKFNMAIINAERNIEATGRRVSTVKDELGKVTMEVVSATGYVEKYKYQWDSVNQTLVRINRDQKDNIGTIEALQSKFKGMINTLKNSNLGNFVDQSALKNLENTLKNVEVLDKKIINDLQNQFNQIKENGKAYESIYSKGIANQKQNLIQGSIAQLQQEQKTRIKIEEDYIKQLRKTAEEKLKIYNQTQLSVAKQLNTRMQSSLGLGVKFNNLSPEQTAPLERALLRYQNLIRDFQQKNISGQLVSDKDLERLYRLESAIKRVYDQTRIASKDSQGFNFQQYPKMENAVRNVTHAHEYYNNSLIQGKKLLEANIQETEKYIKVTQRLREGSKITSVTAYVNKLTGETHKFSESIRDLMTRTWDLGSAFKTAFEKISLWAGATGIFYSVANSIQQIGREIIDVDTKLTELSKVLENNTNWVKLMRDTAESANMMAKSITQALDAEIEFAKQGYNAEQSVALARTSMLGSNVTGLETGQMASYLTGALAQFNIEAEKSSTIIDKLNEVDNNFAVTSIGLAQSINKAGEAAQQYGVDINSLIGYTTAIQTATRESGNQIGNMLKTVFSRINMDKTQEQLASLGIAVKDVTGNLLPLNSIYQSVATKWDAMSRAEKTTTAEALSGRHHITRLMALFDNWNIVTDATSTAQTSLGSAIEENYKHLHSLESQINRNKAAFQELAYTMGESGVKKAMSSVLSVTSQYINGLTEMTKFNGLLVNSIIILGSVILLKLLPAIKTEIKDFAIRNGIATTAIPINQKLAISYATLSTTIKTATVSLLAFSKAMLKNPLTWVLFALTAIPMVLGHFKQVREEQEQLNKTYEETKQKLDDIYERSKKIGQPTLQDINDIDATIKKLDELKNKLSEIHSATLVNKLPKETKDLAVQMGINILEYQTVYQVLEAIKEKQDELSSSINTAKDNSTEYQKTLIDQANNQTKVADNNVKLIDTYTELSNKSNLTAEEQRKLNDITAILTQSYPHLIDVKGDTVIISNKVIEAMKKEAKEQKELADENESATKQQLINNKIKLQDQVKTSLGVIKSLSGEIAALYSLNNAKIDPKWLSEAQTQNTLDRSQGKDTPHSSDLSILLAEIRSPNSTKINALTKKYKEEDKKLKELYDSIASIDDSLNSSLPDLTQSNTKENEKNKEALDNLTDATKTYKNAVDSLNNTLNRLRNDREKMIIGSKEYLKSLEEENEKIREREKLLKNQIGSQSTLSSNFSTSNGKLPNPIPGKALKDSFGAPRDGGSRRHEGIDIMAERGTEIHSTTSGKVLRAGWSGDKGGWAVTVSDPQGNSHYYAHMNTDPSKILGIGQEILAGQVIGYVGDSGNAKGTNHLHYGITDSNKKAINPYNLLTNNTTTTQKTVTTNTSRSAIDRYKISPEIVNTVLSLAQKYNVDPALILAIGEQETNWGKSGDGKKGMYLGYGSYDSGSDYSQAGLENQVEKAIKKMSAWGMTPGNVSFDKLNQGNQGNLPTGIYATDDRWQNSVWNLYKEFSNGQMTTNISSSTDVQNAQDALTNDMIAEQQKLAEDREKNSLQWWEAHWIKYDADMQDIQDEREFTKTKSDSIDPLSQEYRDNLGIQVDSLKEEQDKLHEAAEMARLAMNSPVYKDNQRALKELQDRVEKYSTTWWALEKQINDTSFDKVNSQLGYFDKQILNTDNSIKQSEDTMSQYPEFSQEYRDELSKQSILLKQKEELIKSEIAYTQSQLSNTDLLPPAIEELNTKLQDYNNILKEVQKTEKDKAFEIINSKIAEFDNSISELNSNLAIAEGNMNLYAKGTSDYNKYLSQSVSINKQIIQVLQQKQKYIQQELKTTSDLIQRQKLFQQSLDVSKAILDIQNSLHSQQAQQAEEILQIYKDVYNQQKDLALDAEEKRHDTIIDNLDSESEKYEDNINTQIKAIEKQTELLDKQHDKMTSALDDELFKYDEIIDAKLKLYDDKNSEQDYQSQLTDLDKEKKDLQDHINTLKPDNSPEAIAQRDELNKELIAKNREIDDLKLSHSRETIKDELNAQKDAYKKQIEAKKKSVSDAYNLDKTNLDNSKQAYNDDFNSFKSFLQMKKDSENEYYESQKKIISDYYDEIINDERRWARVREDVISGNLSNIRNDFANFGIYLNDNMEDIGTSITTNIIDKMKEALEEAKALGSEIENINTGNIGNQTGSTEYTTAQARKFWNSLGIGQSYESAYNENLNDAKSFGHSYFWMGDKEGANRLYYRTSDGKFLGTTDPITGEQYGNLANLGNSGSIGDIEDDNGDSGNTGFPIATIQSSSYEYENGKTIMKSRRLADLLGVGVSFDPKTLKVTIGGKKFSVADKSKDDDYKTTYVGIREVAEALGHKVSYNQGNEIISIYHKGGIISGQSSPSKIMDIVNRLFNTQPNESIVKMLKGELAIPQQNILSNFIPNMQNMVNSIIPNNTPAVITSAGSTYHLNIRIDNMSGSKSDINNLATKIINGVKRLGG